MSDSEKTGIITKLGGWERLVIFSGVILSVPLYILLGTAIYALVTDRQDAQMGILLSIISLLVLWAVVWGMLWVVSGFRNGNSDFQQKDTASKLEELQRENERLKKQLAELQRDK